jgi:hypothetical protein
VAFLLIFTNITVAEVVLLAGTQSAFSSSHSKYVPRQRVRQRLRSKRQGPDAPQSEAIVPPDAATVTEDAPARTGRRLLSFALPLVALLFLSPILDKLLLVWQLMTNFLRVGT